MVCEPHAPVGEGHQGDIASAGAGHLYEPHGCQGGDLLGGVGVAGDALVDV